MINVDGLQAYRESDVLACWDDEVYPLQYEASRATLRQLAVDLIAIAPDAPAGRIGELFIACVEQFNDLDMEHEFICTIEREDICEELHRIADLSGVSEKVDQWLGYRDW